MLVPDWLHPCSDLPGTDDPFFYERTDLFNCDLKYQIGFISDYKIRLFSFLDRKEKSPQQVV
jgi:hypothetical protein